MINILDNNMEKQILITTLESNNNFGNRLQAIALKTILEKKGYNPVFYDCKKTEELHGIKKAIIVCLGCLGVYKYRRIYCRYVRETTIKRNCNKIIRYTKKRIKNFRKFMEINTDDYIAVITGSDQVWHKWTTYSDELEFFYLKFAPSDKRIAYAASFGFDKFPIVDYEQHKTGLNEMRFISCREVSGCNLVNEMTGKVVPNLLDPTLCLSEEEWILFEEMPDYNIPDCYILVFFLGKQDKWNSKIVEYANTKGLKIIDLSNIEDRKIRKITPHNFVWLIHHSEMVFTDSFHCTVFSIIFKRPFRVFHRDSEGFMDMFDRISTLLKLTGLEDCEYVEDSKIEGSKINYNVASQNIKVESEKSINWLLDSINSIENSKVYNG